MKTAQFRRFAHSPILPNFACHELIFFITDDLKVVSCALNIELSIAPRCAAQIMLDQNLEWNEPKNLTVHARLHRV